MTVNEKQRLIEAVERYMLADGHPTPNQLIRVVDVHRGSVVVSWGAQDMWSAWHLLVSPDGTCWFYGYALVEATRDAAERDALRRAA